MSSSWKEASRTAWQTGGITDAQLNGEHLKIGCLQRIADATELMAENHAVLIAERDDYKRWHQEERRRAESFRRRVNALRGVITKLKKKSATGLEAA